MEWTPRSIRLFREVGLCLSQEKFSKELGFSERTIANSERGTYSLSLALRRALDEALENPTDAQRERFFAALPPGHRWNVQTPQPPTQAGVPYPARTTEAAHSRRQPLATP